MKPPDVDEVPARDSDYGDGAGPARHCPGRGCRDSVGLDCHVQVSDAKREAGKKICQRFTFLFALGGRFFIYSWKYMYTCYVPGIR